MAASALTVTKEDGGIAVVTLAKEPVNTMDLKFWQDLLATVEGLEADKSVRAMVFQSGLKKDVFTAGLDIKELYTPLTSRERQGEFWMTLSKALVKIYSTPLVTAAAIKGACPAGGCCLALCCDFRVIAAAGSMGLNEVQLGIPVPEYWVHLFASVVGQQKAEQLLQTGDMPKSPQLLELGMVHQVVESRDDVLPAALKEVRRWIRSPDFGRVATKTVLREGLTQRWEAGMAQEAEMTWTATSAPATVASLKQVLDRLGGGKKAPASKL